MLDSTRPLCTQVHHRKDGLGVTGRISHHKMLSVLLHKHTVIVLEFNHPFLCPGFDVLFVKPLVFFKME